MNASLVLVDCFSSSLMFCMFVLLWCDYMNDISFLVIVEYLSVTFSWESVLVFHVVWMHSHVWNCLWMIGDWSCRCSLVISLCPRKLLSPANAPIMLHNYSVWPWIKFKCIYSRIAVWDFQYLFTGPHTLHSIIVKMIECIKAICLCLTVALNFYLWNYVLTYIYVLHNHSHISSCPLYAYLHIVSIEYL